MNTPKPGAVLFTTNHERLARFYMAVAGLARQSGDETHTVLASETFELVLHNLRGAESMTDTADAAHAASELRSDGYVKLFFPVEDLASTRIVCESLGGSMLPPDAEWQAREFRACDAGDPDGNVIQFRVGIG